MTGSIVIGGGLAGAATATLLARAGRRVTLVEREAGPVDKVCGEFLSREAERYLRGLGLDLPALGALPIDSLRLCDGDRVASVPLPFTALSLSRRVLDEALLGLASRAGVTVLRGVKVQGLARVQGIFRARLANGDMVEGESAFLATGKHDVRGLRRPSGRQDDLVAFKLHYRLAQKQAAELSRHVELVLFSVGYAGLSPIEDGRANLCLLVRKRRLEAVGNRWELLLAAIEAESSHLATRLRDGTPCWPRPLALSAIPYGHVQRRADGIWRLGDQAAVIPSFSGDGMSIALHSAQLAAAIYLAGGDANAFQQRLAHDVTSQVWLSTVLSAGLVRRPVQLALAAAARRLPGLMAMVASHTRVSNDAIARTGLVADAR